MTKFKPGDIVRDSYGEWRVRRHDAHHILLIPNGCFNHPFSKYGKSHPDAGCYPFSNIDNYILVKTNAKNYLPDWL